MNIMYLALSCIKSKRKKFDVPTHLSPFILCYNMNNEALIDFLLPDIPVLFSPIEYTDKVYTVKYRTPCLFLTRSSLYIL